MEYKVDSLVEPLDTQSPLDTFQYLPMLNSSMKSALSAVLLSAIAVSAALGLVLDVAGTPFTCVDYLTMLIITQVLLLLSMSAASLSKPL